MMSVAATGIIANINNYQATDSFYSNTNTNRATSFNKSNKMSKSLFDSRFHERVNNVSKNGAKHQVAPMRDQHGRIVLVSPQRFIPKDITTTSLMLQQQPSHNLSKNDSEAARAIKKLKLNNSSKMLVQDQKASSILSQYLSSNPSYGKKNISTRRLISQVAEETLANNPSLCQLSNS